jgi:hypothetical protein
MENIFTYKQNDRIPSQGIRILLFQNIPAEKFPSGEKSANSA